MEEHCEAIVATLKKNPQKTPKQINKKTHQKNPKPLKMDMECVYTEELEFSSNTVISVLARVMEEFLIFTESRYVESRCQSSNLCCWES